MEEWLLLIKNKLIIEFLKLVALLFVAIIGFYVSKKSSCP